MFALSTHPYATGDPKDFMTKDEYCSWQKLCGEVNCGREFCEKHGDFRAESSSTKGAIIDDEIDRFLNDEPKDARTTGKVKVWE